MAKAKSKSSKSPTYTQCLMSRSSGTGRMQHVAWIPTQFARKGRYVKIDFETGTVDGWRIDETWAVQSAGDTNERSQDYKHQRDASDV